VNPYDDNVYKGYLFVFLEWLVSIFTINHWWYKYL